MKYLFVILFFTCTFVFSQDDFATIKFQNLELLKEGWRGASFTFKINGVKIQPDTLQHKIPINKRKLDSIFFSRQGKFNNDDLAIAKFRKNETYLIRINPCSQYELIPEQDAKIGTVEFLSNEKTNKLELKFCVESILFNKENSRESVKCIPSAMCPFSKKEISILKNDEKIDSFYFHFLHGENLFLKFSKGKLKYRIK